MAEASHGKTYGAERGLNRFEGFSDAVFAIALTLLIVEIKVPGSPDGPQGYSELAKAMAEQWREHLALVLCYVVIGAYWLQHHYSGRIYAKSDHWFGAINLLFLLWRRASVWRSRCCASPSSCCRSPSRATRPDSSPTQRRSRTSSYRARLIPRCHVFLRLAV